MPRSRQLHTKGIRGVAARQWQRRVPGFRGTAPSHPFTGTSADTGAPATGDTIADTGAPATGHTNAGTGAPAAGTLLSPISPPPLSPPFPRPRRAR